MITVKVDLSNNDPKRCPFQLLKDEERDYGECALSGGGYCDIDDIPLDCSLRNGGVLVEAEK